MSKFKIGDKVFVLYIHGLTKLEDYNYMIHHYPEFHNAYTITELTNDGGYYLDDSYGFWFPGDALKPANPGSTQRTRIGLETELHSILLQVNKLQEEIDKLKALEE